MFSTQSKEKTSELIEEISQIKPVVKAVVIQLFHNSKPKTDVCLT